VSGCGHSGGRRCSVARSPVAPKARTTKPLQLSTVKVGSDTVKPPAAPAVVLLVAEIPDELATTRTRSLGANPTPRTVKVARGSVVRRGVVADAKTGVRRAMHAPMTSRIRTPELSQIRGDPKRTVPT